MARIGPQTEQYFSSVIASLRSEPLTPRQLDKLTGALGGLKEGSRLTAQEIDSLARDLRLPEAHKATLIFGLFYQENKALLAESIGKQKIAPTFADALQAVLDRARRRHGEEAEALESFFLSYAGPDAAIRRTGEDLFSDFAPGLSFEGDGIKVKATPRAQWEEVKINFMYNGDAHATLEHDGEWVLVYDRSRTPLRDLDEDTFDAMERVLRNDDGEHKGHAKRAVEAVLEEIDSITTHGSFDAEFPRRYYVSLDIEAPHPKPDVELGMLTPGGEGGEFVLSHEGRTTSLYQMSIATLQALDSAVSELAQQPFPRSAKRDREVSRNHISRLAVCGLLLDEIEAMLKLKQTEAKELRAQSLAALSAALKDYRVERISDEAMNILGRNFG